MKVSQSTKYWRHVSGERLGFTLVWKRRNRLTVLTSHDVTQEDWRASGSSRLFDQDRAGLCPTREW
jgi:hypothetical protein